jgi:hypothetical protein
VALAAIALPDGAAAETLVPPDNSAVDQYTETYPTAGGDTDTRADGGKQTPARALDPGRVRRLRARGPAGAAVAALTVATAPSAVATGAARRGGTGEGGSSPAAKPGGASSRAVAADSSGLGPLLGQATGLSGGARGALLLAALLAAALWALAYRWRSGRSSRSGSGP